MRPDWHQFGPVLSAKTAHGPGDWAHGPDLALAECAGDDCQLQANGVPSTQDFWHRRLLAIAQLADVVELVDTQDLKS